MDPVSDPVHGGTSLLTFAIVRPVIVGDLPYGDALIEATEGVSTDSTIYRYASSIKARLKVDSASIYPHLFSLNANLSANVLTVELLIRPRKKCLGGGGLSYPDRSYLVPIKY